MWYINANQQDALKDDTGIIVTKWYINGAVGFGLKENDIVLQQQSGI